MSDIINGNPGLLIPVSQNEFWYSIDKGLIGQISLGNTAINYIPSLRDAQYTLEY